MRERERERRKVRTRGENKFQINKKWDENKDFDAFRSCTSHPMEQNPKLFQPYISEVSLQILVKPGNHFPRG